MPSRRALTSVVPFALSLSALSLGSLPAGAQEPPAASPSVAPSPAPVSAPLPVVASPVVQGGAPLGDPPPPAPPSPAPDAPSSWYGWQTLIADGATLVSSIAFAEATSGEPAGNMIALNGLAGYAFAAPMIHLLHHRPLIALLDLAIRAGAPTLGGYIGAGASSCHQSEQLSEEGGGDGLCGLAGAFIGVTIGAIVAVVVDSAVLARTPAEEPEREPAPTPKLASGFTIAPDLVVAKDHGGIGIRGTF
jgi:hypothetical protein